jgi:hypothetical protein
MARNTDVKNLLKATIVTDQRRTRNGTAGVLVD